MLPHRAEHPAQIVSAHSRRLLCAFAENPAEDVITPVRGTSFDSLGKVYYFYNLYSWENWFGIRYGPGKVLSANASRHELNARSCLFSRDNTVLSEAE